MERANAQNAGSTSGQKGRGLFDAEDFLGLAPTLPIRSTQPTARELPPLMTPPVYKRGQNGRMEKVDPAPADTGPTRAEMLLARELARAEAPEQRPARPPVASAPIVTPPSYDRRGRRIVADQPGWSGVLSRSSGNPLDEAPLVDIFTDPLVVTEAAYPVDLPAEPFGIEPEAPAERVEPPHYVRRDAPSAPALQEMAAEPVLPSLRRGRAPSLPITSRRDPVPTVFIEAPRTETPRTETPRAPAPTLPITSRRETPVFTAEYLDLPDADPLPASAREPEAQPTLASLSEPKRGSIREPLALRHAGIEHPALGWTTTGVTLEGPLDPSPRGERGQAQGQGYDVTLLIGAGRTRIEMRVHVREVAPQRPGTRDYAFVGLDLQQQALLAQIEHQAGTTGPSPMPKFFEDPILPVHAAEPSPLAAQLAAMIRAPEQAAFAEAPLAPEASPAKPVASKPAAAKPVAAKAPRRLRLPLRVGPLAFGLTCAVSALAIWAHAATIDARYAAVSVATTSVAMAAPGFVTEVSVIPGQSVAEGAVLAHVLDDVSGPARAILSPCDCVVTALAAHEGDFVTRDQAFATLSDSSSGRVHALVSLSQAGELDVGDRAAIHLIDGTEMGATVGRIGRVSDWPGYSGLDAHVFAADRYARVELVTDAPVSLAAGTEAQVSIQSSGFIGALQVELAALTARLRAAIGV